MLNKVGIFVLAHCIVCLLVRGNDCTVPYCGAFIAAIDGPISNCSVVKIVAGSADIEYDMFIDICQDVDANGSPKDGLPRSAQNSGNHTGDGSFLYFTSGTGKYIHQVYIAKTDDSPVANIKAILPHTYDFIIGMQQLSFPDGPLYVLTTSTLYQCERANKKMKIIGDLSKLSLTSSALLTASTKKSTLYIADVNMLHVISLPDQITSISLPKEMINHIVDFIYVDDDMIEKLVVLLDSYKIMTFDPDNDAIQMLNVSFPTKFPLSPMYAYGMGITLYLTDSKNMYTLYVDSPAELYPGVPFVPTSILGNLQFFL